MEIKISKIIKDLVKEYPNNYDLGGKVRELVLRMEKITEEIKNNKKSNIKFDLNDIPKSLKDVSIKSKNNVI